MKTLLLIALIFLPVNLYATASIKKALGAPTCSYCHFVNSTGSVDYFANNDSNPKYMISKAFVNKIKKGDIGYKGKKCIDCHSGKLRPEFSTWRFYDQTIFNFYPKHPTTSNLCQN